MAWYNMGEITSFMFKWLSSFVFWGILLFILLVVVFGSLMIRKRRKLIYPLIELTDLGAGKIGFRESKAGWFKTKTMFFGLYDYGGEDILRHKDGRTIQAGSSEDFHDINGKRGVIVIRKSDDPAIMVPVTRLGTSNRYVNQKGILNRILGKKELVVKNELDTLKGLEVTNPNLLAEIAPADYRDASGKIVFSAEKETMGKWEKWAPYLVFGTMAIIFMITIILITQMVKNGQAEAKDLILQAGKMVKTGASSAIEASTGAP